MTFERMSLVAWQVCAGDRVLDPYCGSAGLLLAAAKLGASTYRLLLSFAQ
jgi:tRNA G10  N-methylase Trm11